MHVEIFSVHAACAGREQVTWAGEVEVPFHIDGADLTCTDDDETMLEALYRLFNRVDEADAIRLEQWGYRLPSLSVGDFIAFYGATYQIQTGGCRELDSKYLFEATFGR